MSPDLVSVIQVCVNKETTWQIHFALGLVDIRKMGDKRVKCCYHAS